MVTPQRKRLRISQRLLEAASEFVHPHGAPGEIDRMRQKWGQTATGSRAWNRPSVNEALRPGNHPHPQPYQHHLREARPGVRPPVQRGNEAGDGDVQESRSRYGQRIREHAHGPAKAEVRDDSAHHRGQASGHVQYQRPPLRHAGVHEERKVTEPVRNLVRRNRKRRDKAQRLVLQKGRRDKNPVQHVVNAVAYEDQDARRFLARRAVPVVMPVVMVMPVAAIVVVVVTMIPSSLMRLGLMRLGLMRLSFLRLMHRVLRLGIAMRVRVPPQHNLFDHKENAEAHDERDADVVRAFCSNTFHRLWEQREQCRTQEGARGETHEMREDARAGLFRQQQEHARERSARDTTKRREQNDPTQERHELSASFRPVQSS